MTAKQVLFSTDARRRMLRGVNILSDAVKATLVAWMHAKNHNRVRTRLLCAAKKPSLAHIVRLRKV